MAPSICHGQPYLAEGAGVRIIDIVDRVRAGDSALDVANDFGVRPGSVRLLIEMARAVHPVVACRPIPELGDQSGEGSG